MKRKDIIVVVIGVVVFVVAAALIYRYFAPPTADSSVIVTVPRAVEPTFNQSQLNELKDPSLKDYTPDITPNFPDKPKPF